MAVITNTVRWASNTDELKKNLLQGIDTIDAMKKAVDRTAQSLGGTGLLAAANRTAAAIEELGGATKLTKSEQERANALIDKAIDKYKALGVAAPSALLAMRDATDTVAERTKRLSDNLSAFSSSAKSIGSGLSVAITAPIVAASAASLAFSGTFEASMTRLVSLAGVSQTQLKGVKQHILDLAPAVGIGPQALADAMMKISSTVSDSKTALSILDIAARGSAAGMGTAVDVAGALTAVVNSYGAANISAAEAGDILTQTVKEGGAEAKELAPTLANVTPLAAQMGISFAEVGANLATVTKLGVPAAEAVTQLSSVMSALLKENAKGAEALKAVGSSYAGLRTEVREKGLLKTIEDLSQKFKGNEEGLADVFGRIEALRNVMSTSGAQAETYANVLNKITHSVGSLDGAFALIKNTQVQTWAELSSAVGVAAIQFGDALAPSFKSALLEAKPLLQGVIDITKGFGDLPEPVRLAGLALGGIAVVGGPALYLTGQLAGSITNLLPLIDKLSKVGLFTNAGALVARLGAFGPAGLAIAGAGAALYTFNQNMKVLETPSKAGQGLNGLSDRLKLTSQAVTDAAASTKPLISGLTLTFNASDKLAAAVSGLKPPVEDLQKEHKEHAKALETVNAKIRDALRDVGKLTTAQQDQIRTLDRLGISERDIAIKMNVSEIAVKKYTTELHEMAKLTEKLRDLTDRGFSYNTLKWLNDTRVALAANSAVMQSYLDHVGKLTTIGVADNLNVPSASRFSEFLSLTDTTGAVKSFTTQWEDFFKSTEFGFVAVDTKTNEWVSDLGHLSGAFRDLATVSGGTFAEFARGIGTVTSALSVVQQGQATYGKGGLANQFAGLAGQAAGLIQATDPNQGQVGAVVGGAVTGAQIGTAVAPGIGTAVGAGVGALIGWYRSMDIDNAVKEARKLQDGFVSSLQAIATQGELTAGAMINGWHATNIVAQRVLRDQGYTADQITALMADLYNTDNPAAYAAAVGLVTSALQEQQQRTADLQDASKGVDEAMSRWNITIDQMGPAFKQQNLNEMAGALLKDWKLLTAANGDNLTILGSMKTGFQELALQSLKTGSAIPENLKPAFQSLIDMGEIVDENGNKLTDVGQLQWTTPLEEKFKTLIDKISDLVDVLTNDLPNAINGIPNHKIKVGVELSPEAARLFDRNAGGTDQSSGADPGTGADGPWNNWGYGHRGGLVTPSGIQYLQGGGRVLPFVPRGIDTVPTMLATGEGVVTREGMDVLGSDGLSALNAGRGLGGAVLVDFNTAALEKKIDQLALQMSLRDRRLPAEMAVAMTDALLTSGVGKRR